MKSQSVTPNPEADLKRWCDMLAAPEHTPEEVPHGWYTVRQIAKARGRSECATGEKLRRMAERGEIERKSFTIKLAERVRPVSHYRFK